MEVGDRKLGSICEEEPFTNSEFESDEDKKVEMMGDAIPQKENVVKVCEKVGESGEDLCRQKIGKVNECAKGDKVRLLIAEFEKKLGSVQWNNNGKSKVALSTLPDKFVCSSENNKKVLEKNWKYGGTCANGEVGFSEVDKHAYPFKICLTDDERE
ncbi:hypothetical protein ACTXT7_002829 [Hymenolepis weldensis]